MQAKEKDGLIAVRLFPNEDLFDSLSKACKQINVQSAVIVSGIGQFKDISLGYFRKKGDYSPEEFPEPYEIISLTGNVGLQDGGEYAFHMHVTMGDEGKKVLGGHLLKATVAITGEIFLLKSDIKIVRKVEEETGLKGMFLEEKK